MKRILEFLTMSGAVVALMGCGEKVAQVSNSLSLPGYWLMTESEHSNKLEKAVENESMVLAFKNGQVAFSPTDSLKGHTVYAAVSHCSAGPRPYRTEDRAIVFTAVGDCPEKRVSVQQLDQNTLKFTDPDNADVTRTFVRIDDAKYQSLVKNTDRHL